MNKVLQFMNLRYDDLYTTTQKTLYREDTNIFAYYIVTAILLMNYTHFIDWCYENNNHIPIPITFSNTEENTIEFAKLIIRLHTKIETKTNIRTLESNQCTAILSNNFTDEWMLNTLRMSVCEMYT